jgi:hypothetical protein
MVRARASSRISRNRAGTRAYWNFSEYSTYWRVFTCVFSIRSIRLKISFRPSVSVARKYRPPVMSAISVSVSSSISTGI